MAAWTIRILAIRRPVQSYRVGWLASPRSAFACLRIGRSDARESGAECPEHPFGLRDALTDCCETFRWIDVALGLAPEMPFDLCGDDRFAHLGDFAVQHRREAFGLGTLRGLYRAAPASA